MMIKNDENIPFDEKEGNQLRQTEKQSLLSCDEKIDEEQSQDNVHLVPSTILSCTKERNKEESNSSSSTNHSDMNDTNEENENKSVSSLASQALVVSNDVSEDETTQERMEEEEEKDQNHDKSSQRKKNLRKAGVAVAGGALITAGVPLIPVLCAGELMIIGGMALLATEFDSAKNVLTKGKEKLVEFAQNDDEMIDTDNAIEKQKSNESRSIEEGMDETDKNDGVKKVEEKARKMAKNMKLSLKKMVKNDILPVIDRFTETDKKENSVHETN